MVVPSSVETSPAVAETADAHLVMATMLWAPQAVLLLEPPLMFQRVAVAKSMVTWTPQASISWNRMALVNTLMILA